MSCSSTGLSDTDNSSALEIQVQWSYHSAYHNILNLSEWYTQPRTKVVKYHVDRMKNPEIVHAQHQDVLKEVKIAIHELLVEYEDSSFDVIKVWLIIGDDHRKGAFRLCFYIILNVKGRKKPVYKTKSILEVYCVKEEGIILEKSISLGWRRIWRRSTTPNWGLELTGKMVLKIMVVLSTTTWEILLVVIFPKH